MDKLREHNVVLSGKTPQGADIRLRPMAENDWDILVKWNSDPEVLYYSEGADVNSYNLEDVQSIYRSTSKNAFCFIIELAGNPVGECWLQKMNLEKLIKKYPGLDSRRIDLMIGEKQYWGKGIGTEVIRLLLRFGFLEEKAAIIFGCGVADYNVRSFKAFQRAGFEIDEKIKRPPGKKAKYEYNLFIRKEKFIRNFAEK